VIESPTHPVAVGVVGSLSGMPSASAGSPIGPCHRDGSCEARIVESSW